MYQAIYYCKEEYKYFLRDSVEGWTDFKYTPTCYVNDYKGEYLTLDGKTVSPTKKYDWRDPNVYEKDISRELVLLRDLYYEEDEPPQHNLIYLDIECEIGGALTPENIRLAGNKITALALYEKKSKKYTCFILDEAGLLKTQTIEGNREIVAYTNEEDLLDAFLNEWENLDPTIVSTWNGGYFDIPYLYHRIKNVLGEFSAKRLSPIGKIRISDYALDVNPVKIGGVNHLDYMQLFKKFISKQETSYKLGDIGDKYVKLGKLEYHGSLDKLFKEDINKFIEYNLRDVEILVALEEKMKFIDLALIICHLCHVEYESVYLATVLNEGRILTYLKRKGIVSVNKPTTLNPALRNRTDEESKYAGGFVLDPKVGLHHYVFDCDAASLYPTIMMSLNMSPETLIGRIIVNDIFDCWWSLEELKEKPKDQVVKVESINGKVKKITVSELIEYIESNNLSISANGVMFRTDEKGVIPEVLEDGFARRQEFKKEMKLAGKKGDWETYKRLDLKQHSFKILINSLYGAMSLPSFRFTDGKLFISSAITLTGQRLIQESIKFINSEIKLEI